MEINSLSKCVGLTEDQLMEIYNHYWSFIRQYIKSLPLKNDLTEEEFNKLRTSINLPNLGKLGCTYKNWKGRKTHIK